MPILLQINVTANWGSTGKIAEQLGDMVIKRGWQSYIAYGRFMHPSNSNLICIGSKFDIFCHFIKSFLFDRHGLGSSRATAKFIKRIENIHPDIVHIHNLHGYYINYSILFSFLNDHNIPLVWTFHDCWPITGHCSHFSIANCSCWKNICSDCHQICEYPRSLVIDNSKYNYILKKKLFTSNKNMVLVPVSQWMEHVLKSSFLAKKEIRLIYNGVDTSIFRPNPILSNDKDFIILAVASRWSNSKGLSDYVELITYLPDNYKLILIGLNSLQKKHLPDRIQCVDRISSQIELVNYYSQADVVLNLSYQESFGLTTVEGLSCGTPGIVYNSTASPELITPETGFVVSPGDIQGLLKSIYAIKEKGKSYYSYACRLRALHYFDKNKNFLRYYELYEELLKDT